tara:strand:- start:955 stop:2103 length:1149 start_codon:yes stop_codon:yes gene_type:complete
MKKQPLFFAVFFLFAIGLLSSCKKEEDEKPQGHNNLVDPQVAPLILKEINSRNFNMGFSTWPYGPDLNDQDSTYEFINNHTDIYSEHIDDRIPWSAWINGTALPQAFVNNIQGRKSRKLSNRQLIVSVSLLNSGRSDLALDYNDSVPDYDSINQNSIRIAYYKHLEYIIQELQPDYLVAAIEVNELRINTPNKWSQYKKLMNKVRDSLRQNYPELPISESVTLHNWYNTPVNDSLNYLTDLRSYLNDHMDFAAISFYPFFKGLNDSADFQQAFDFLHQQTQLSIGFVETTHLAEDLIVPGLSLNIPSSEVEQNQYLSSLLINAYRQDYEFVIWWAHRDYDELWQTFPPELKDLGSLWKDTGILEENGKTKLAYLTWREILRR